MIEQLSPEPEPKERQRRPLPEPLIYRERDLDAATRTSRQWREDAMREGTFPKPIPLSDSGRARGWLVSEIRDWLDARKAKRDAA